MAQRKKENASKHTFRLYDDVTDSLEEIARAENRTVTAQMEVFLREQIQRYRQSKAKERQPA